MKHAKLMAAVVCASGMGLAMSALADPPTAVPPENAKAIDYKAMNQDPRARELLDAAKARLMSLKSLVVDYAGGLPTTYFDRAGQLSMARPNRFKMVAISGLADEVRTAMFVCDGQTVADMRRASANSNFMVLDKKVRAESFYLGVNPLVEFFFNPKGIAFDPGSELFGRPISEFDTNVSAYDKDTKLTYLGKRTLEGVEYEVVEIKYNTKRADVRQQVYIGADKLVYEVDTSVQGVGPTYTSGYKFRNYELNPDLPEATWQKEFPPKVPVIQTDPVRMGQEAPDFTLPGYDGGQFTLKELMKGKKGLFVCVLNGEDGRNPLRGPDFHLPQMRLVQQMKDKFEKQGLGIVCIVGGEGITPDVVKEMKINWMPDVSRFNYPIVIDVDLERGIQGSAYQNFQLNGRNSLLLDGQGRVVFASKNFEDAVNNLAFYQALAQIGFSVSPADLENAAKLLPPK